MKEQNVYKQHKRRSQMGEVWHRLKKNKGAMLGLVIVVLLVISAITAGFVYDFDNDIVAMNIPERLQHPSWQHLFGTDEFGRDVFARVLYASRYSLAIGLVAVVVGVVIGVVLGAIAGYFGGVTENIIMRAVDVFAVVPAILMAIVIVAVFGQSFMVLMLAIGITSVPVFVRITRAAVITVRDKEYVESCRAIGLSEIQIIFKHVLPNCLSPIIVQATLRVGTAIISASSLSFLGLGMPLPTPEWGSMLSSGRSFIRDYSYMTLFPGLAIMITVLALNLFGDGLRDALDPKLKK